MTHKTRKLTLTDLKEDAKKEGFCLIKEKESAGWKLYRQPQGKSLDLKDEWGSSKIHVGHLAYPNPNLKNEIPQARFYTFKKFEPVTHPEKIEIDHSYETLGKIIVSVNKETYLRKIKAIRSLLKDGEIYQLNFAIRFRKKFDGEPYALFLRWAEREPSRYAAFLNCGSYQILSNSPECLFSVQNHRIKTEPIKGTIPKNKKKLEVTKLLMNEKEKAELEMITDLARNDIGQICEYGSLKLEKNRALMELPNLWHTYSRVSGKLPKNIKMDEIIHAMFPGGSITGCPKKRAMEHIEKLEGLPRNIFTGSIGEYKRDKNNKLEADFNIAIRTALVKDGYVEYWAGGGITIGSEGESEYNECYLKAEKFLSLLS